MYGLVVMQSISNSTTRKNIGKIKCWRFFAKNAFLYFSNQPRKNTYTSMDIPSPPLFIASKLGKYCLVLFLIFKPFDAIFGQNTKCTAKNALWSQSHFIKVLWRVIFFFCLFDMKAREEYAINLDFSFKTWQVLPCTIFKPFDAIFGQYTKCTAKNAHWSQIYCTYVLLSAIFTSAMNVVH